ncbi:MAG: septal ring lytic transglycosylase RlpA family protein [Burkholderiales bacterium]|nr:septal ring lytic transglycosylase RlpA family protein [Burkholderiales bacterium]
MLGGCGTAPNRGTASESPPATTRGGYYLDDGPPANPPRDLHLVPDAVPKPEPIRRASTRPYVALGTSYRPMTALRPYKARGLATWYGRRYHGKPTASGEPYDMYSMSAAHTILPLPSYARVTNLATGKSVVVRVNDRGPFVDGRLIDVSYAAAHKLGILGGATMVEVEAILPGEAPATAVSPPPQDRPGAPPDAAAGAARSPGPGQPVTQPAPTPEVEVAALPPHTAAPAPAAPMPPQASPAGKQAGGVFLQLGTFASRENADGFLARLQSQAGWLALGIVSRDGLHRVQAGPYDSESDARQAAGRISQALGVKALLRMQ